MDARVLLFGTIATTHSINVGAYMSLRELQPFLTKQEEMTNETLVATYCEERYA